MIATYTEHQQEAIDKAVKVLGEKQHVFKIGGYAGTGKTTIAKEIMDQVKGCIPCAFTGKAAYRLREKGIEATTIHKAIYYYDAAADKFRKKPDVDGEWFLIDEGSMVSGRLWDDITSFRRPVLLLGDPGQLEPVGEDRRLMHTPDVILTEIHRQAEGNGIIDFATDVRLNRYVQGLAYPDVDMSYSNPSTGDVQWADIILCGRNATKAKLNKAVRQIRGHKGVLEEGERLVVLKNNAQLGVFNGQIMTVDAILREGMATMKVRCVTDDEDTRVITIVTKILGSVKPPQGFDRDLVFADYGYAITTHKSQGSEWDKVLVVDEQCPRLWEPRRWRYTAITRAAKELRYIWK